MKNHNQFGGGGHHGGHHGGGWGGGWGYPLYYPYPMYPNYGSLYLDIPRQDENFIIENGLIKKKKKKTDDDKKMSAAGDPAPRPMNPGSSGGGIKSGTPIFLGSYASSIISGTVGAVAGYFVAKGAGKNGIAGAVIGLAVLGGGAFAYKKFKK